MGGGSDQCGGAVDAGDDEDIIPTVDVRDIDIGSVEPTGSVALPNDVYKQGLWGRYSEPIVSVEGFRRPPPAEACTTVRRVDPRFGINEALTDHKQPWNSGLPQAIRPTPTPQPRPDCACQTCAHRRSTTRWEAMREVQQWGGGRASVCNVCEDNTIATADPLRQAAQTLTTIPAKKGSVGSVGCSTVVRLHADLRLYGVGFAIL